MSSRYLLSHLFISNQAVKATGLLFSEQICDKLLSSVKSWGRDAWNLIADIDLGMISPDALTAFVRISRQCFDSDPSRFAEAINKISLPSTLFSAKDAEHQSLLNAVKRLCVFILCCSSDFLLDYLSLVQAKVVELLQSSKRYVTRSVFQHLSSLVVLSCEMPIA